MNKYNDSVQTDSKITQQLNHGWITAISYSLTKIKFSFISYYLKVIYYLMMESVWVIKRASVQVKCHKIEPRPTIYFSLVPFNFYCISSLSHSVSFRSPHYYSFVNILYTFLSDLYKFFRLNKSVYLKPDKPVDTEDKHWPDSGIRCCYPKYAQSATWA